MLFIGPLSLVVAMSFFVVRNFQMVETFEFDSWSRMISRGFVWDAYVYTLSMAGSAAVLASLIAFPAAYCLAFRTSAQTRQIAILLLIIPFFTSYLVRIYSWKIVLSSEGVINFMLGWVGIAPLTLLINAFGATVGYLTLCLPLTIMIQYFALSNIDRSLIGAAHNLGCTPLRTTLTVTIPAAKVGLILAATFAFILSFGDYVSPAYLGGGKPPTMSILIVDQTKSGNHWPRAAVVAVTMVVTLIIVLFAALFAAYGRPGAKK